LVTGGASGIGRAAAELFAAEGARVFVADVDAAGGVQTVDAIVARGGTAVFRRVDVSDERAVEEMVDACVAAYGRLDAAMNNAGISDAPQRLIDLPAAAWRRMIAVNLSSVFFCLKYEIRQMLAQEPIDGRRGAIVNTSSGAGVVPAPGQPHYTAAKHGVLGLTKSAAQEYVGEGIRVNAVCPGLTETGMVANIPPPLMEKLKRLSPGGEIGRAADVAAAAVWLCSPQARWVNGQSLVVDGGGILR
jgi:NAD(P)-dependent dehydrogenase (short-subunit alcohol dehydrogenase family)